MGMPPNRPKISEVCYITHTLCYMLFFCIFQLKGFFESWYYKKGRKKRKNTIFNLFVYLSQEKTVDMSLKHKNKL